MQEIFTVHLVNVEKNNGYGVPIRVFKTLGDAKDFCEDNTPDVLEDGFEYRWRSYQLEERYTKGAPHHVSLAN